MLACRGYERRNLPGVNPFRTAVEARDLDAMKAALADDVVFHSPVTFKAFTGRDDVGAVLGVVFGLFEDFRYTDELEEGSVGGLVFRARVGDREVEGLDLLRLNDAGEIADFTVMVRPLSGVIALAEGVGPRLQELGVAPSG